MCELSHIPSDWKTASVSSVADVIDPHPSHRAPEEETSGIPFAGIGDLDEAGNIRESKVRRVSPEIYDEHYKRYRITNNTIGFGRVASIGKIIAFKGFSTKVTISPTIAIIEPNRVGKDFLVQALKSEDTAAQINLLLTGSTRSSLGIALLRDLIIPYPPLPEQQKIASILSSVDDVIEKTRAQIDKLKDLKTGMMQELLTKGIGHTEFKDSPVGRIPVAWKYSRFSDVTLKIQDGTHFSPQSKTGDYLYITSKNIQNGKLDLRNISYISKEEHDAIYRRCNVAQGDILLTKDGANTGNCALNTLKQPFSLLSSVAFLRCDEDQCLNEYMYQYICSPTFQKIIKDSMTGNAITRLTLTIIKNLHIPLPAISEQHEIVSSLRSVDNTIDIKSNKLAQIFSIKKALMQDLLTGKVRVKLTDKESAVV